MVDRRQRRPRHRRRRARQGGVPARRQRSHVDDTDGDGRIFSRDCPEYHFAPARRQPAGRAGQPLEEQGVRRPARRRTRPGAGRPSGSRRSTARCAPTASTDVVVVGDLNDTPDSVPLAPLLRDTDLRDISDPSGVRRRRPARHLRLLHRPPARSTTCCCRRRCSRARPAARIHRTRRVGRPSRHAVPHLRHHDRAVHAGSDHAAIYADIADRCRVAGRETELSRPCHRSPRRFSCGRPAGVPSVGARYRHRRCRVLRRVATTAAGLVLAIAEFWSSSRPGQGRPDPRGPPRPTARPTHRATAQPRRRLTARPR